MYLCACCSKEVPTAVQFQTAEGDIEFCVDCAALFKKWLNEVWLKPLREGYRP